VIPSLQGCDIKKVAKKMPEIKSENKVFLKDYFMEGI
jgi:hypothetical protein